MVLWNSSKEMGGVEFTWNVNPILYVDNPTHSGPNLALLKGVNPTPYLFEKLLPFNSLCPFFSAENPSLYSYLFKISKGSKVLINYYLCSVINCVGLQSLSFLLKVKVLFFLILNKKKYNGSNLLQKILVLKCFFIKSVFTITKCSSKKKCFVY